jgi:hypothetical protein
MAKLGYTFYPKDWGNSESVFELTLSERGLYREFIDLAMINDNKIEVKKTLWCRKFGTSLDELELIMSKLIDLKLIVIKSEFMSIPSCETRLILVRSGAKGGTISKPTPKPNEKPSGKPSGKPNSKQIEIEKEKEIEDEYKNLSSTPPTNFDFQTVKYQYEEFMLNDSTQKDALSMKSRLTKKEIEIAMIGFVLHILGGGVKMTDYKLDFKKHFNSWFDKFGKNNLDKIDKLQVKEQFKKLKMYGYDTE